MVSTGSGALKELPYSFRTRFEDQPGTNPEELIAAAHAGCFSMALSAELGKAGMIPESIRTSATLTMENVATGWTVTAIHLGVSVKLPNADAGKFEAAANAAKAGCPISRLLNTKITMDAKLEG
jgi:osmotically inducible protein OsmC